MPALFRKRNNANAQADEDPIPEDILASIPDVNEEAPPASWQAEPAPADWRPTPMPAPAPAPKAAAPDLARTAAPYPRRGNGVTGQASAPAPTPVPEPVAAYADVEPNVAGLVADVRRQMESVFSRELGKVEDSFTATLRQLEGRLERTSAEADALRRENESLQRLKADYERKVDALRELALSFDKKA